MKKTYIIPTTVSVALKGESLMQDGSMHFTTAGNGGTVYQQDAEGDALSRGRSVWDDDE